MILFLFMSGVYVRGSYSCSLYASWFLRFLYMSMMCLLFIFKKQSSKRRNISSLFNEINGKDKNLLVLWIMIILYVHRWIVSRSGWATEKEKTSGEQATKGRCIFPSPSQSILFSIGNIFRIDCGCVLILPCPFNLHLILHNTTKISERSDSRHTANANVLKMPQSG